MSIVNQKHYFRKSAPFILWLFLCFFLIWLPLYFQFQPPPTSIPPVSGEENIVEKLKGKILLQVESRGEAWYVNPRDGKKYFLGRPKEALQIIKIIALGIDNENLISLPTAVDNLNPNSPDSDQDGLTDAMEDALGTNKFNPDSDNDGYNDKIEIVCHKNPLGPGKIKIKQKIFEKVKGLFLIQAESHGELWYLNPDNGKKYFLHSPVDIFNLFRLIGLGITDYNLNKIPTADLSSLFSNRQTNASSEINRSSSYPDTTEAIKAAIVKAIKKNNANQLIAYLTPDIQFLGKKTLQFLDRDGRYRWANLLASAVLSSQSPTTKTYTTYLDFYYGGKNNKIKIDFTFILSDDGKWRLANL